MQRRFHIATLVADVLGQLRLQTTLQRSLAHPADQALLAREGLAGIDLREDLIQRARSLELVGDLLLPPAPLLTIQIRLRHNHNLFPSETKPPHLHKPSDTPQAQRTPPAQEASAAAIPPAAGTGRARPG